MDMKFLSVSREGVGAISISAGLCLVCLVLGFSFFFVFFLILFGFFVFFFRDPEREIPQTGEGSVLSAADGKVIDISEVFEETFLKEKTRRISVFLSIFDCHINRSPASGRISGIRYCPGKYSMAFRKNSSGVNERLSTLLELEDGARVVITQVAGFLARRIVLRAKFGDKLEKGEKFGMIKFGSRVDIYLPAEARVQVAVGQKVKAGATVLAWLA